MSDTPKESPVSQLDQNEDLTKEDHLAKAREAEGLADAARGVGAILDADSYLESAKWHKEQAAK